MPSPASNHAPRHRHLIWDWHGTLRHDLAVARALGVDCVLIAAGHHPAARSHSGGAPVFPDLAPFAAAFGFQDGSVSSASGGKI